MALDYSQLYCADPSQEYATVAGTLASELPACWLDEYYAMRSHTPNVLQFEVDGFEYLFDFTSDPRASSDTGHTDDRLVAVFGYSRPPEAARDASQMRGFLGGGLTAADGGGESSPAWTTSVGTARLRFGGGRHIVVYGRPP